MDLFKKAVAVLLGILLAAGAAGCGKKNGSVGRPVVPTKNSVSTIEYNGVTYRERKNVRTYLVMGIDACEYKGVNGMQADMIEVLVLDDQAKTFTFLLLDQATLCEIQTQEDLSNVKAAEETELGLTYTFGNDDKEGCEKVQRAVEALLQGRKIDRYVTLRMEAITALNDTVGGIEVTIEDDFSSLDNSLSKGETVTLTGEQADHYVRGRLVGEENDNTARMRRQHTYLTGFLKAVKGKIKENPKYMIDLYKSLQDQMVSNINSSDLLRFAKDLAGYTGNGYVTVEGSCTDVNGRLAFRVNENSLMETILPLFYEVAVEK